MPIFKTNRDFDSTLIVCGIHVLLGGIVAVDVLHPAVDMSSFTNNLVIIYGMICSYFFKSQQATRANGEEKD